MTFRTSIDLEKTTAKEVFDRLSEELSFDLSRRGISIDFKKGGELVYDRSVVGRIVDLVIPHSVSIDWWLPDTRGANFVTSLNIKLKPSESVEGTTVEIEHNGWENVLSGTGADTLDWFMDCIAGNLFQQVLPTNYGNWLFNRLAGSPSGAISRRNYANPIYHRPNFMAILEFLSLTPEDYLLEVGSGGGYFLMQALKSGCRASAIDHSPDMVKLASEQNSKSIAEGRLDILEGDAEELPFHDSHFTCAVCTGVFAFIQDPTAFFSEMYRVLAPNGRIALFTGSKELKGTPAEIDPLAADKIRYYEDEDLIKLAKGAGFKQVSVTRPDLKQYAMEAGVPEEAMELFSKPGGGGQLLTATKE